MDPFNRAYSRPFRIATKRILLDNLKMGGPLHGFQEVRVCGVRLFAYRDDLIAVFEAALNRKEEWAVSAKELEEKARRLDQLMSNHPDLRRLPAITKSEKTPLSEDKEVNDLLLESNTLAQMYKRDFVFLFMDRNMGK